jgi:hypothetical protein
MKKQALKRQGQKAGKKQTNAASHHSQSRAPRAEKMNSRGRASVAQ